MQIKCSDFVCSDLQHPSSMFDKLLHLSLSKCEEVGVIKRVHLLSGEVRSVTTSFKVLEKVQEEVHGVVDE